MLVRALIVLALLAFVAAAGIVGSTARQRLAARALPIHPFTGLRAVGIVAGRPVFPIAGGAPVLEEQQTRLDAIDKEIDDLVARDMPDDDVEARAANEEIRKKVELRDSMRERIRIATEQEARRQADADTRKKLGLRGVGGAVVTRERKTYDPGERHSYFLDLARTKLGQGDGDGGIDAARDRLERHAKELDVDLPAREARRDELAEDQADHEVRSGRIGRAARETMFEKRVNPNRTDGQGGFFVPPLWLIEEYAGLARAGRPFANRVRSMPLPVGTDSINVPKITTGTLTGVQTADNAPSPRRTWSRHERQRPGAHDRRSAGRRDAAARPVAGSVRRDRLRRPARRPGAAARQAVHQRLRRLRAAARHPQRQRASARSPTPTARRRCRRRGRSCMQGVSQIAKNRKMPATDDP
jgi:hypothetical protein